jgi:Flp pilus assembly pilin Flp
MQDMANAHATKPAPAGIWRQLADEQSGATTLEWALLLAAMAIPSYFIIATALETLLGHYRMLTSMNALPFP